MINLTEKLRFWLMRRMLPYALRRTLSEPLPAGGRSSREDQNIFEAMGGFLDFFEGVNPLVPFEWLDFLTKAAIVNPDISHATTNLVSLANNGHQLVIEAQSDAVVERAQERLNAQAKSLYPRSAGVDGLINHDIYQIAVTGASSREDVIAPDLSGVERVVFVPTRKIRFKLEDGDYQPYQKLLSGELIKLNPETYSYYAFKCIENSPYAMPLYVSAIEPILTQRDMQKNIRFIIRKAGLLGLVMYSIAAPRKLPGETENEREKRHKNALQDALKAIETNYFQGLMVKPKEHEVEHANITGDSRGSREVFNANEEQVMSGLNYYGVLLGRPWTITETFGNVLYRLIVQQAENVRRLSKRRMERTYNLDLLLQGIPAEVTFSFNEQPARDPLAQSEADAFKQQSTIQRVEKGIIEPDVGAQELGYDEWFDPDKLNIESQFGAVSNTGGAMQRNTPEPQAALSPQGDTTPDALRRRSPRGYRFVYKKSENKYVFQRARVWLPTLAPSQGPGLTGPGPDYNLVSNEEVQRILQRWGERYLNEVRPFLQDATDEAMRVVAAFMRRHRLGDFTGPADFAAQLHVLLAENYVDAFRSRDGQAALKKMTEQIYSFYRLEDTGVFTKSPGISFALDVVDRRSLRFMKEVDRFYLGRWIFNEPTENSVKAFLEERFLEGNESIFRRTSREALDEFIRLARDRVEPLMDHEARRIISTSVQRMRTWGNLGQLEEAGFEFAQIFNASPEAEICIFMNGKVIPVGAAREAVDEMSQLDPDQFKDRLQPITPALISAKGVEQAVLDGEGFPPFHPNCKTRVIAHSGAAAGGAHTPLTAAPSVPSRGHNGHHKKLRETVV